MLWLYALSPCAGLIWSRKITCVNVQGVEGHGVRHSPGRTDHVSDAEPGACGQSKPGVPVFSDFKCCTDVRFP